MSETAQERKRRTDRERVAAKRAAMTAEERAAARVEHDRKYRQTHRQERLDARRDLYARHTAARRADRERAGKKVAQLTTKSVHTVQGKRLVVARRARIVADNRAREVARLQKQLANAIRLARSADLWATEKERQVREYQQRREAA